MSLQSLHTQACPLSLICGQKHLIKTSNGNWKNSLSCSLWGLGFTSLSLLIFGTTDGTRILFNQNRARGLGGVAGWSERSLMCFLNPRGHKRIKSNKQTNNPKNPSKTPSPPVVKPGLLSVLEEKPWPRVLILLSFPNTQGRNGSGGFLW